MKKLTAKQLAATAAILGLASLAPNEDYALVAIDGSNETNAKNLENLANCVEACGCTINPYEGRDGRWVYIINVNA